MCKQLDIGVVGTAVQSGELAPDVGRLTNRTWCYFAPDVAPDGGNVNPEDGITVLDVSEQDLLQMAGDGRKWSERPRQRIPQLLSSPLRSTRDASIGRAVPPGETLTAQAVAGALGLAAVVSAPEKAGEKFRKFFALGIEIAQKGEPWKK